MPLGTLEQKVLLDNSAIAAEDLSPYTFIVIDGNGQVAAAGDGVAPDGIVLERWGADEMVHYVTAGRVPIKIGTAGSLSEGDSVATDTNGEADAGTTGDPVAAVLLAAPSADGDIVQARVDVTLISGFQTI